jgi:hypothetical protein
MKYYRVNGLILAGAIFGLSFAVVAIEQSSAQQKSETKSMGEMSMGGMMKQCHEQHEAMAKNLDDATKALDGVKQSNDPAEMRTAISRAQKDLTVMREQMAKCGNMMNMMEKMQGMGGGMMKGETK